MRDELNQHIASLQRTARVDGDGNSGANQPRLKSGSGQFFSDPINGLLGTGRTHAAVWNGDEPGGVGSDARFIEYRRVGRMGRCQDQEHNE